MVSSVGLHVLHSSQVSCVRSHFGSRVIKPEARCSPHPGSQGLSKHQAQQPAGHSMSVDRRVVERIQSQASLLTKRARHRTQVLMLTGLRSWKTSSTCCTEVSWASLSTTQTSRFVRVSSPWLSVHTCCTALWSTLVWIQWPFLSR